MSHQLDCLTTTHYMRTPVQVRHFIKQAYRRVPFRRPLLEVLRRTVRLPGSVTGHLHFQGPFTVEIDASHRFRLEHWGYLVETDLFWNGFGKGYEATSLQVWSRLVPHARVILDVGANTGLYTLAARCLNSNATVISFEPVERVFRRLQRNLELNGYNVTLEQVAVSDISGTARLYDLSSEHEYTASLERSMLKDSDDVIEYTVPTKRLDDVLSSTGFSSTDLIKIDVELFEPQVLLGLGNYLWRSKPTMLIEILNDTIAREIAELTRDLGYKVFQVVEQRGLIRCGRIEITEFAFEERNYLFAQDEIVRAAGIADFVVN